MTAAGAGPLYAAALYAPWESSEGPQEPFTYRGSSLEVPGQYGSKLYQSAIPSLSATSVIDSKIVYALDGLEMDCAPSSRTYKEQARSHQRGRDIEPLLSRSSDVRNSQLPSPIKSTRVISVVRALRFHAGCVLSQDISSFGRIDPILVYESHGYFRPDLVIMRRKLSRHFPAILGRVI